MTENAKLASLTDEEMQKARKISAMDGTDASNLDYCVHAFDVLNNEHFKASFKMSECRNALTGIVRNSLDNYKADL